MAQVHKMVLMPSGQQRLSPGGVYQDLVHPSHSHVHGDQHCLYRVMHQAPETCFRGHQAPLIPVSLAAHLRAKSSLVKNKSSVSTISDTGYNTSTATVYASLYQCRNG